MKKKQTEIRFRSASEIAISTQIQIENERLKVNSILSARGTVISKEKQISKSKRIVTRKEKANPSTIGTRFVMRIVKLFLTRT